MKLAAYSFTLLASLGFLNAQEKERKNDSETTFKPNVVIILTDDQGYGDSSCYGCKDFKTPHIDALAASGVRFTNGYVTHPYCSPSRAGILTGQYQQTFGHEHNPPRYDENDLKVGTDVNIPLMPTYFTKEGYRTGAFGKWHIGEGKPFRPVERGFDHFWGFLGGGHDYFKVNPKGKNYNSPIWIDSAPTDTKLTYVTDDLTDAAIKFIEKDHKKPFLVYLAYNAPHFPDQVKPADLERNSSIKHMGRRKYAALMTAVDDNVGKLVKKLEDLNMRENTLIFYLSDNGGRRSLADSRPFRGNKGWLYEGGIRVPFIVSYPQKLKANVVSHQPIISLDILPTALAAAGIKTKNTLHGESIFPLIEKNNLSRTLHWRTSGGKGYAIRSGKWKAVNDVYHNTTELYDLSKDREERTNLAETHPEKLKELIEAHQKWNATLEKPRWYEGHTEGTIKEWNSAKPNGYRVFGGAWYLKK